MFFSVFKSSKGKARRFNIFLKGPVWQNSTQFPSQLRPTLTRLLLEPCLRALKRGQVKGFGLGKGTLLWVCWLLVQA